MSDTELYCLEGDITLEKAMNQSGLGDAYIKQAQSPRFDFAAAKYCDSASICLLLSWVRLANSLDKAICFEHVPNNVLTMMKLYGVLDLLNSYLKN